MTQNTKKPAAKLTTEQAVRRLFPKAVVDRAKEAANPPPKPSTKPSDPSMNED